MCVVCRCNEELDDKAVIRRLKCRVAELETELVLMRKQYLSEQNKVNCSTKCHQNKYTLIVQSPKNVLTALLESINAI